MRQLYALGVMNMSLDLMRDSSFTLQVNRQNVQLKYFLGKFFRRNNLFWEFPVILLFCFNNSFFIFFFKYKYFVEPVGLQ